MKFMYYFLLFAISQIFLLIFLLEKRKKINIKFYKLASFWIMILGVGFLIGSVIYVPIKKSNSEPKTILEYNITTDVDDFNMKDMLEPIVSKFDKGKDIYFSSYLFTFEVDENQDIILSNSCTLYGSYKGKYYQLFLSYRDGKCTLTRYQRAYENYYKDMNLLTLDEVLEMNDIINYDVFYNEYSKMITSEFNKEVRILLSFRPSKFNTDSSYINMNVLDENGNFTFYEVFDINLKDIIYFDYYCNGNKTTYLMVG